MTDMVCYLYWIHTKDQIDVFSEGYVGISCNPKYRFIQHRNKARKGKIYNKAFLKSLLNDTAVQDILVAGSISYCKEIESKLRPKNYVGWNVAIGGDGGIVKHGLSGSKVKGSYYNMLTRANISNIKVCPEWSCKDSGLENFAQFYNENVEEGLIISIAGLDVISPETVKFVPFRECTLTSRRNYELDGEWYSLVELAEKFNIKPNTLCWRMKRGETLRQALRLENKEKRKVFVRGRSVEYNGRMTPAQIEELRIDVESGIPILHLGDKYGFDPATINRLAKRFGITIPVREASDLMGGRFTVASHSKLSVEDYNFIKCKLLEGFTKSTIAGMLGVSNSSLTNACKKLKWEDYLEIERTVG